jgi:hypothetical protein
LIGKSPGNHVQISHLQFVDDTLIVGEKSCVNIRAVKVLLILFELVYGLKFNFYVSMLVCLNVEDSWLFDASLGQIVKLVIFPFKDAPWSLPYVQSSYSYFIDNT